MLIEVRGLHKRYGHRRVLAGLDFALDAGEVVGLAGVNGAGKSTTLGILLGLLAGDAGEATVLGRPAVERARLERLGWMPEQPAFPPRRRVRELVRFQAASFPTWDDELADRLAERLEIDLGARAGRLSRGERGRLALLFALAHRPDLLLLDDPTLGLDPGSRRLLLGELLATAAEQGAGVLLSTHLLAEVELALDRLLVLHRGSIVLDRTVEELRRDFRRVEGVGAADLAELAPISAGDVTVTSRWDEPRWRALAAAHPGARAGAAGLEEIFVALTGEDR